MENMKAWAVNGRGTAFLLTDAPYEKICECVTLWQMDKIVAENDEFNMVSNAVHQELIRLGYQAELMKIENENPFGYDLY